MDHFSYINNQLRAENVSVADIAKRYGTPCYVYSRATLEHHWRVVDQALADHPHLVCYSVKANSNIAILNLFAKLGSGFDVVSGGELERVLVAGGDPKKIVFSGIGKTAAEIERALSIGILCFNIESVSELDRLQKIATQLQKIAPISFRINPDINARTHPYIATGLKENKFGIDYEQALDIYEQAARMSHLKIIGVDCHIGSQLTELEPFTEAADRIMKLIKQLATRGIQIEHVDLGGGLGVRYYNETPPNPKAYAQALGKHITDKSLIVIIEPGRVITANAGILVTKVEYLKHAEHKNFAIVDAGMNDLIRPSLYDAWHEIIPVAKKQGNPQIYDVVGPVCETGDFLGKNRELILAEGDLLAIRTAGAYGFCMSSNYNSRPRSAEVLVDNNQAYLIRKRETIAELFADESLMPET
jgi:diaminopimelate decarboxylase